MTSGVSEYACIRPTEGVANAERRTSPIHRAGPHRVRLVGCRPTLEPFRQQTTYLVDEHTIYTLYLVRGTRYACMLHVRDSCDTYSPSRQSGRSSTQRINR